MLRGTVVAYTALSRVAVGMGNVGLDHARHLLSLFTVMGKKAKT